MPFAALSGMMEMFEATRIETEKKLEKQTLTSSKE